MKKILTILIFALGFIGVKAQTYNPLNGALTNKPIGIAQAVPTDMRSFFYDSVNHIFRAYQSTAEVLSYLNLAKWRGGNFPIYVHSGGTLNGNGTYTGGVITQWWFKDGVADVNLVAFAGTFTPNTLFIDPTFGGGSFTAGNGIDQTIHAPDSSKQIGAYATQWDLTQLGLGTTIITDSSQLLPTYNIDSLSNVLETSASAGHNILIWTGATGGLIARINDIAEFNGTIYNYVVPHNGDIARTNYSSQLNGAGEFYQYDSIHVLWKKLPYPVMAGGNYQLAQLVIGTKFAEPMVFIIDSVAVDSIDTDGNWYDLNMKGIPSNNYSKWDSATGRRIYDVFSPLVGVKVNGTTYPFDVNGISDLGTISGSGTFNFDSALATKTTDDLTQGVTNLYNQTHTGDATGATALTVVGIRSKSIPTLSAGNLKYNGTAWVFDNTTYLSSYTETDPLALKITNNLSDVANATTALNNILPSQTSNSGKVLQTNGTNASWQTPSGGGGLDTSNSINANMFSGLGYSDNRKVQLAYNLAQPLGKSVVIGWNNDRNSLLWKFDSAVRIGSNITFILNQCTIQKSDSSRDNLFRTTNIDVGVTTWLSNPLQNIYIVSYGAEVKGADNPRSSGDGYQTISLTPTILNGFTYGTDAGKAGRSQLGDWRNNLIQLSNVSNFRIFGLKITNSDAYGFTCGHCSYGWVDGGIANNLGYANGDTARRLNNEGTWDFHQGSRHITVSNSTGFSQDDAYAWNTTNNTDSTAGHLRYYPEGDTASATIDSTYDIVAYNIHVGSNANTILSFVRTGCFVFFGFSYINLSNELKTTDPFYHRLNGTQASAFQPGATATGFYGGNISWHQITNLNTDNIKSRNTSYLIRVQNRISDCRFLNLDPPPGIVSVYKDGSFADFSNVISNEINSTNVHLADKSGFQLWTLDSVGKAFKTTSLGTTLISRVGFGAISTWGANAGASAGGNSVAMGDNAQRINTGINNVAIGVEPIYNAGTGSNITAIGNTACDSCGGANSVVAVGSGAAKKNTADNNTAVGTSALVNNTTGIKITANGYQAVQNNTVSNEITGVGYQAVQLTGAFNTGVGAGTLAGTGAGARNSFNGARGGMAITSGSSNTGNGFEIFARLTSGSRNTGSGDDVGYQFTSSESDNTLLGNDNEGVTGWNHKVSIDDGNRGNSSSFLMTQTSTTNRYAEFHMGFAPAYVSKATSYTATNSDHTIEVTATGQTITIPSGVVSGFEYTIKLTASGSCTVSAAANIDGASTYSLSAQYKYVTITWNGSTWLVTANN